MDMLFLLMKQNIIMFIYLLIGFFLYRKKLLTTVGSSEIGKILIHVIMPVAILKSYMTTFSTQRMIGLGISFVAALFALIFAMVIAKIIFRKTMQIEQFGSAFSNAGFMGIPLVQMMLGDEAVFYISSFVALLNIFQWTYGVYLMTGNRTAISFKKIRKNPIVLSFILGIILFFTQINPPELVVGMAGTIASMNGPLAMIVLGAYLAQIPFKELLKGKSVYQCSLVRLFVIPLGTLALLSFLPKTYEQVKWTILIAASAPVGSNIAIFAQIHNNDYKKAVKVVCLSTIASIVTMPLILGIASYIW